MASKKELFELIGRAATDPTFQSQALTDPVGAAQSAGVQLTQEEIQWLRSNPPQWTSFINMVKAGGGGGPAPASCGNCLATGH